MIKLGFFTECFMEGFVLQDEELFELFWFLKDFKLDKDSIVGIVKKFRTCDLCLIDSFLVLTNEKINLSLMMKDKSLLKVVIPREKLLEFKTKKELRNYLIACFFYERL